MNSRKFAILACLLSLALHVLFFCLASRVALNGAALAALEKEQPGIQEYQAIHLKKPPENPDKKDPLEPNWEDGEGMTVPEFQDLGKNAPLALKSLEEQEVILQEQTAAVKRLLEERITPEAPVTVYQLNAQPPVLTQPELSAPVPYTLPKEALEVSAPRPEILEIHAADLPENRLTDVRMMRPELEREFVPPEVALPSLANPGELAGPPPAMEISSVQLQSNRPQFAISDKDLGDLFGPDPQLPGNNLQLPGSLPDLAPENLLKNPAIPKGILEDTTPLDEYVQVTVFTYPDPAGPGGTFLVELRPGANSASMPDIPKDVLFILDRSSSISLPKFNEFKNAVREVLPSISPADRFNIISFNDKQSALFPQFVYGTTANLTEAAQKVARLPHGGRTDVFGSVAPFVRTSNGDRSRPLNIFLLTDGQSTVNIYEPSQFLKEISGINPGNVSIFPFSAEKKANRMLLDFLGYLNKGEKCHVETTDEIRDAMVRFYSDHSSLIVTDLRCAATDGANVNEIFPRSLPHLYRNQTLRLFGRYENKADVLTLSVTGRDAEGRLRDLVFRSKLDQCPQGAPTLPAQWAGQKILFLLSRLNLSANPAERSSLSQRIEALKTQYSILSPY
ncbi:MAG: VWA domain-containing protein [Lentisphaeria bacterium]|nr:VWA domain-containing protein [Lentisphaeria bacterium]